jgi:SLOG in TRPM, prokaryote/SMODS and SLOG-associating 2TM effector domain 1/Protein of unknown function (DUF4231)
METKQIIFTNGNIAQAVLATKNENCGEILQALTISQPTALLIVIGGANNLDDSTKTTLQPLFRNGIAATATEIDALILDGGTKSGIMELMGQGVAEQEHHPALLGIAPEGKVCYQAQQTNVVSEGKTTLDPHHSHFILVKGEEWGDETSIMFGIAHELGKHSPVVTVLANGGNVAKQEVLQSVQHGWPIVVITDTGQLADSLANWWRRKKVNPSSLQRVLLRKKTTLHILDRDMKQGKKVLEQIMERETFYAHMAGEYQKIFKRIQFLLLILGVLATALALGQTQMQALGRLKANTLGTQLLHVFVVLIPIAVTVLLGITTYFKWGNTWVMLRNTREALKQEIFRYRTHTGIYEEKSATEDYHTTKKSAEQMLVEQVKKISQRFIQTEVNTSVPTSPIAPRLPKFGSADEDNNLSDLTPDRYMKFRLDDQLTYYRLRSAKWNRDLKIYQPLVIIASGFGALLAAINLALWLPLATALGAAFALYLEYMQVVTTLTKYNQATTNLEDVKHWWTALPESEKNKQESFNKLVEATEKILESEHESWVQNMQNAIDKLYRKESTIGSYDDV